jgi:hypothetical protein
VTPDTVNDADTSARLLKLHEEAITQWRTIIAEIETGRLPRPERRKQLFKARSRLGEIECSAQQLRIAMATEAAP